MKLTTIEQCILVINNEKKDYIYTNNGETLYDKKKINHFVIIHATKPEFYDKFFDTLNNTKDIKEKEDGKFFNINEEKVDINTEEVLTLIAKQRKINCPSLVTLNDNNWFICPVYEGMTALYPAMYEKLTSNKGYRLHISRYPLFNFGKSDLFNKDTLIKWNADSVIYMNQLFNQAYVSQFYEAYSCAIMPNDEVDYVMLKNQLNQVETAQRTRIKIGNTLISMILNHIGQNAYITNKENIYKNNNNSDSEEELEDYQKKEIKILDEVKKAFKIINMKTEEMGLKEIRMQRTFDKVLSVLIEEDKLKSNLNNTKQAKTLKPYEYIDSYLMYESVQLYMNYVKAEEKANKILKTIVEDTWLWNEFSVGVKGFGLTATAYIMANIDFRKANHPSQIIRYMGLDTVIVNPKRGEDEKISDEDYLNYSIYLYKDIQNIKYNIQFESVEFNANNFYKHFKTDAITSYDEFVILDKAFKNIKSAEELKEKINVLKKKKDYTQSLLKVWNKIYLIDGINVQKKARDKSDKVITTYIGKDGKLYTKYTLGYNAKLKAKILETGFENLLKQGNEYYIEQLYKPYKERIRQSYIARGLDPDAKGTKQHIHAKARRFTIQRLLEDIWKAGRIHYGLPLNDGTYYEAKIKGRHHHGIQGSLFDNNK